MIFKKDNFIFGLILGLVTPFVGFLLYKFVKFKMFSLGDMFHFLKSNPEMITSFISISLLANAIIFTIFINSRRDKTAKGIFLMTVVWAIISLVFKYW
ncbi:MAG: hypothetical protein J0H55_12030 [Chitinophagaceae bacterium]|nr:hypothetical protein [Chitinophagaceae bacterium]